MVRIQDSQSWHRGSIPLSTTKTTEQGIHPTSGKHNRVDREHNQRWIHLMVRIQDSQSWHRGSIPLSTTTDKDRLNIQPVFVRYTLNINIV